MTEQVAQEFVAYTDAERHAYTAGFGDGWRAGIDNEQRLQADAREPMPGVTMKELLAGATQNADVAQSLYVQALGIRHALKTHNVPDDVWAVIWRDAGASLPDEIPF